jgi:hypothetical protein
MAYVGEDIEHQLLEFVEAVVGRRMVVTHLTLNADRGSGLSDGQNRVGRVEEMMALLTVSS